MDRCGITNFFITLMTIKGMECASHMPIDLFFEAPRLMDLCNFTDDHTSLTRDVHKILCTMEDGSEYYTTLLTKN